jgi:transcriptional regulator with XRE-family HTH domain
MADHSPRALRRMLRLARDSLGMTQARLGDELGSASRTVIRWEQGRSEPGPASMLRLADMVRVEDPDRTAKPAVLTAFARAAELEVSVAEILEGLRALS